MLTLQKWNDWDSTYNSLIQNNAMNDQITNTNMPTLDYINFIFDNDQEDVINGVKNGSIDITLQYRNPYDFISGFEQLTDPVKPIIESGFRIQFIHYNLKSPIWGMIPKELCTIYNDISCELTTTTITTATTSLSTTTTGKGTPGFTFYSLLFMVVVLGIIHRKNKKI